MQTPGITGIESKIYFIRDQKVLLDSDLALLYGVAMLSSVLKSERAIQGGIPGNSGIDVRAGRSIKANHRTIKEG